MHYRTEDLLTIRDREPLDAAVRAAIDADPGHAVAVDGLRRMQHALEELPEIDPPPAVWERVLEAERFARGRRSAWKRGLAGVGIAAGVAAAALIYVVREPPQPQRLANPDEVATVVGGNAPTNDPLATALGAPLGRVSAVSLVEQSARLDRLLARMPRQRSLMNGATAGTIAGLEDRIGAIDEQLSYGAARGLRPPERDALWGERVELMNALVHVRYAQVRGF